MKIKNAKEALALSTVGRINVVYGYTGSGKSSVALTTTKNKKIIYIDIENTVGKIWGAIDEKQKNIKNLSVGSVDTIEELIEFINSEEIKNYGLLVIDSITFLAEQELGNKTDKGKKLSFHDYGDLGQAMKQVLRRAQMRGLNILFIMQATQIETDSGRLMYFPRSVGQQITPAIVERADNIFFIEEKNGQRSLYTKRTEEWHAKKRDQLPDVFKDEEINWENIEKYFSKYEPEIADKKELKALLETAKVKDPEKLYKAIDWDKASPIYRHQIIEAQSLLAKQIEANNNIQNESN